MYAIIDLGSNSFHMLVATLREDSQVDIVERYSRKVQLGSGIGIDGRIAQDAIVRGLDSVEEFVATLKRFPIKRKAILGTNALRQASNAGDFISQASARGLQIDVISGEQEAALIYRGVTEYINDQTHRNMVVDIGGGSTELANGTGRQLHLARSLALGCVTWRDRFFSDGFNASSFSQALAEARQALGPTAQAFAKLGWDQAYASSGTAKLLSGISSALGDREGLIHKDLLQDLQARAMAAGTVDALDIPGLKSHRRDVLVPGLSILAAVFEELALDHLQYSRTAVREGMLYALLAEDHVKFQNFQLYPRTF